jgi:hypothetical protein
VHDCGVRCRNLLVMLGGQQQDRRHVAPRGPRPG